MKNFRLYFVFSLLAVTASCVKVELRQPETSYGYLEMSMAIDEMTKAVSEEDLRNSAQVKIYKKDYSGLVREYAYADMPSPFYLAVGEYRADVFAGECVAESPVVASWDSKSYKGTADFTIEENQSRSVEVLASVNNAVTAISFDQTVADNFNPGYSLTIGLDSENAASQLIYDASNSGTEGYFIIDDIFEPSFKWTFTGTLAKDGSAFTRSGEIPGIAAGKLYKMTLRYTVKDGSLDFTLMVDTTTENIQDDIIFVPVSTGLSASSIYEIWATRATVHADVDVAESEGKSVEFAYSEDGGTTWIYASGVNESEGTWNAQLKGLKPSTRYTYALMIDRVQIGDVMTFTTEAAPVLPNGSFEHYSKVSGQEFYKFYKPDSCSDCCATKFWASGNGDEQTTGSIIPGSMAEITTISTDCKDGSVSVLAQSLEVLGMKLAAGNLFTGQFLCTVGTNGGKVNFGRPWTSRPSALRFYCKYTTDKMDYVDGAPDGVSLSKNDYDRAQIKIALGTWNNKKYGGTPESPVCVNTTNESTFVDFYTDESTIANGDIIIHNDGYVLNKGAKVSSTTSEWTVYEIPLEYRDLNTYPTHIIISCAASQYGDYFSGSTSSRLWLDKFELVYE